MGEDEQNAWTFSIKMPDGTMLPFSGTIESVEVADMERKVKGGDKVKVTQVSVRVGGTYKVGDILTVTETFGRYPGYIRTSKGILSPDEYEIITDEIKVGDKVTLIDKPWEWDGWAKLDRKRRRAYSEMIGKEIEVRDVYQSPSFDELKGIPSANTGVWFIPLALLRKVEPVKLPFDFEPEPVKAEPKRVPMSNKPHPEIKEGAKFVVLEVGCGFNVGDIVTLHQNDQTVNPDFKRDTDGHMAFRHWGYLAPLETKHRYTPEQIDEAKCYLAESMVSMKDRWTITKPTEAYPVAVISGPLGTGKAKCAPDDEFNVYIGLMVAFKRYHNEPLPTWIRG